MEVGAERRFEAFVARSSTSLLRAAWLLTGDHEAAEDIVQTALERTAQRWNRLTGEPEGYARRIVVNLARDSWRRRRRRPHPLPITQEPAVADSAGAVALRDALLQALRTLPHRQRSVLVLRYFLDLDEAAIAETLNISVGTVKSSTSRALARLRDTCPELSPVYAPKD